MLYFLIVVLPNLRILFAFVESVALIVLGLVTIYLCCENLDTYNDHYKESALKVYNEYVSIGTKALITAVLTSVCLVFMPSKSEIAVLFAANALSDGVESLAKSERIQSLSPKVLDLVHKYLDDKLDEAK
jgi:hypothetical protein